MEFIIVAPIYLCLFGAVFLFGEVLLARVRLWNCDRTLAWTVNDRMHDSDNDLLALVESCFRILTDDKEAGWQHPAKSPAEPSAERISREYWAVRGMPAENDQEIRGNHWVNTYQSQMQLSLQKIPAWIRGPMKLIEIFRDERDSRSIDDLSIDFYRGGTQNNPDRTNDRHYVLRREIDDSADWERYDRLVNASRLVNESIVWNVASDAFPGGVAHSVTVPADQNSGDTDFSHKREFRDEPYVAVYVDD